METIKAIFIAEFLRRMDAYRGPGLPEPDEASVGDELAHDLDAALEQWPKYQSRPQPR